MKKIILFFIFISLLSNVNAIAWTLDYSNTHGAVSDWPEKYDSAGKFVISQDSTSQKITASSNASEIWGGYSLNNGKVYTDAIFRLDMYDYATYPRSMLDHVVLRIQPTNTNGYYFYCSGSATGLYNTAYWQPYGCTWGSTTHTAAASVWGRYDFKITGNGWNTTVIIYNSIGQTLSAFSNPSLNYSSGNFAHGYTTRNYYSGYCIRSNIYIYDLIESTISIIKPCKLGYDNGF